MVNPLKLFHGRITQIILRRIGGTGRIITSVGIHIYCRHAPVGFHLFHSRFIETKTYGNHDDNGCRTDHNAKDCQDCSDLSFP